jgi:hypothetical protein
MVVIGYEGRARSPKTAVGRTSRFRGSGERCFGASLLMQPTELPNLEFRPSSRDLLITKVAKCCTNLENFEVST